MGWTLVGLALVVPHAPYRWHSLWVPYIGDYPIWDYPAMVMMVTMILGGAWIAYSRRPVLPFCVVMLVSAVSIGFYSKVREMRLDYSYDLESVELKVGIETVKGVWPDGSKAELPAYKRLNTLGSAL